MVVVFLGFVATPDVAVKQIGLGLAVAVLVDATIVRLRCSCPRRWNCWATRTGGCRPGSGGSCREPLSRAESADPYPDEAGRMIAQHLAERVVAEVRWHEELSHDQPARPPRRRTPAVRTAWRHGTRHRAPLAGSVDRLGRGVHGPA